MHSEKVKNKVYSNLLIILASFGILYLFTYPMYTGVGRIYSPKAGIKSLLQDKDNLTSALTVIQDYDNKLGSINSSYTRAISSLDLDTLDKILPVEADPVLIAYEITKIAARSGSGMLLSGLAVREGQSENKKYNTMTLNFNTEGTYDNLLNFLHDLEISKRIYNVTSLNFSSDQDNTQSSLLKYSLTVETYYINNNEN